MRSIRTRLAAYFIIVIFITVIFLEVLIINVVRQNYYKNLENNLQDQIKVSADLYFRYFSDSSLNDNVLNNVDTFWKQANAQVEIIDNSGNVLMDSIGIMPPDVSRMEDVREALLGKTGKWIGNVDYDDEMVMAVSCPLKSRDGTVGILRFITSLREVNRDVEEITNIFVLIGIAAILISCFISFLLANTIVGPLKEITSTAEKMAAGNFNIRSSKSYDDEVGKLSDTLNYMAEEINKKDRLKNDFITSVSHELRTPLTSIKGWAVTLKGSDLLDRDMFQDGLEIIEKESDRLTSMVEELLDLSKFVSGEIVIKSEKVDIAAVVKHIETQLAPRAEREKKKFSVTCGENLPECIITDGNRLKQVFINILDNSFKFTATGGKLEFVVRREESRLIFDIKDDGCGISPDELPRVKEKFFKGRNSNSKNGIGLSVCDEIIRLLGGTFEIYSEINCGVETVITLPVKEG